MADALTDYAENQLINHLFRTASFSAPATLYFGLFTAAPTDTGSLTNEVSGGNYARVSVTVGDSYFAATAVDGSNYTYTTNSGTITFPTPSASWGTVTYWGMMDSATLGAGNMLAYGALTNSKVIGASDPAPQFPVGALSFGIKTTSTYLDGAIINHLFRTTKISKPSNVYAALLTGTGPWTEVSAGGYGRVTTAVSDANFAATSGGNGQTTNNNAITFGSPTADWGAITAVRLYDAGSSGNILAHATFAAKNVNNGDSAPSIVASALTIALA